MDYIKLNDDGNPEEYDIGNFRRENPNTSFPANISDELYAEWGVFKVKKAPKPNFDALTHKLQLSIELVDGSWTQVWAVESLPDELVKSLLLKSVAGTRYDIETNGLRWTDADGQIWNIATDLDSQLRLNSTVSAINNNLRADVGNWKCQKIVNDEEVVAYRLTTNDEILEWSQLVYAHVQKCFEAEANAAIKIFAGDFSASFQEEYDLL